MTAFEGGEPLQALTAIGEVAEDEPYQVEVTPAFRPWGRNVDFIGFTKPRSAPLIEDFEFMADKKRWGYKFRLGVLFIEDRDLDLIRSVMTGPPDERRTATVSNLEVPPGGETCSPSLATSSRCSSRRFPLPGSRAIRLLPWAFSGEIDLQR